MEHEIINLSNELNIKELKNYFNELACDPYVKEGFRFKEIARYKIGDSFVELMPHGPMVQSSRYNPIHGDIIRNYNHINPQFSKSESVCKLLTLWAKACKIPFEQEILFQAQRVICHANLIGVTSVEGWHQDGCDFLGLLCIGRHNICGGVSGLALDKGKNIVLEQIFDEGELLILDDKKYWHYGSPIQPLNLDQQGMMDVIILASSNYR